eukprot:CAMPEP_0196672394 /NCGR_PEP_ID=MMETSP1090-20130531/2361_1 /TAXON_ID=37098 /ORGANISM="Isochrysis sp, Strain CCMP1244" /LENGTH=90 /DNA_ID=CAMNT_0042010099 /DNA_START=117 /DNA_END=385 /DNA_ORIENTATION=+
MFTSLSLCVVEPVSARTALWGRARRSPAEICPSTAQTSSPPFGSSSSQPSTSPQPLSWLHLSPPPAEDPPEAPPAASASPAGSAGASDAS